jgi:hypothetical protein
MKTRSISKFNAGACLLTMLFLAPFSVAGDLDDGIGIDEPISDDIEAEKNISFIVVRAKARARNTDSDKVIINDENGVGNISIGAGTDLDGATIINLSDNDDAAVVSE